MLRIPDGLNIKPIIPRPKTWSKFKMKKLRRKFGPLSGRNRWSNWRSRIGINLHYPRPTQPGLCRNFMLNGPPATDWERKHMSKHSKWIGRRIRSSKNALKCRKRMIKNFYSNELRFVYSQQFRETIERRLQSKPGMIINFRSPNWIAKVGTPYYLMGG